MSWLNNIFNNSKKFEDKISLLEKKLRKADSLQASLEEKIVAKEQDVTKADKSIQKIIQIWRNINSSEALPKVLATILGGLCNDLDFLYCLLFQIYNTENGPRLKVSIASEIGYFNLDEILGNKLKKFSISYDYDDNFLVNTIKSQEIKQMQHFHEIFKCSDLILNKYQIDRLESIFIDRAMTVVPLMVQGNPFGCLVAVSLRKEVNSMDNNYLKLFAGQIELSVSMTRLLESVKAQAVTDVLTGLYNRRYFNEALAREVKKAQRSERPFTLITLDLDHLKQINDTLGHTAGDAAIAAIGAVLKKNAREIDIAARFGGEEFALIMPDTEVEEGLTAAERIRSVIASQNIEGVGHISASIGVATFLKHTDTLEGLFELADQAMYSAKNNGRNRVEVAKTTIKHSKVEFL